MRLSGHTLPADTSQRGHPDLLLSPKHINSTENKKQATI